MSEFLKTVLNCSFLLKVRKDLLGHCISQHFYFYKQCLAKEPVAERCSVKKVFLISYCIPDNQICGWSCSNYKYFEICEKTLCLTEEFGDLMVQFFLLVVLSIMFCTWPIIIKINELGLSTLQTPQLDLKFFVNFGDIFVASKVFNFYRT